MKYIRYIERVRNNKYQTFLTENEIKIIRDLLEENFNEKSNFTYSKLLGRFIKFHENVRKINQQEEE